MNREDIPKVNRINDLVVEIEDIIREIESEAVKIVFTTEHKQIFRAHHNLSENGPSKIGSELKKRVFDDVSKLTVNILKTKKDQLLEELKGI